MPRSLVLAAILIATSAQDSAGAAERLAELNQTAWRIVDIDDTPAEERSKAVIRISTGEIHFTVGCFDARYRLKEEGGSLSVLSADKNNACNDDQPMIAASFDRSILKVTRYRLSGDELSLSDDYGLKSIELARKGSIDIQSRELQVISFFDGGALVTPKGGLDTIAIFAKGQLRGSLGCGSLIGSYVLSGDRIRISAGEILLRRCMFPRPHDSVIIRALRGDHIVQRDGGQIVLRDDQGTIQIVLAP
jgi:hypothetical protein